MPAASPNRYQLDDLLSPRAKDALAHLELFARQTTQGLLHGHHKSRRLGTSTDFDHHKEYIPGDPLKHIDWKASARHDRYYLKRYTEDSSMAVRLVVDRSASMLQMTEGAPTKYLAAARIAACLAYLVVGNRDSVALTMASDEQTYWSPAGSTQASMIRLLRALASLAPAGQDSVADCLGAVVDRAERRGIVVLITDAMYDPAPVQRQLARLQAQGHEVLIAHIYDQTEQNFPFNRWVQFGDLEDPGVRHRVDAVVLRRIYLEQYEALVEGWRQWAKRHDAHLIRQRADEPVEAVLSQYLRFRSGKNA